MLQYAFYSSSRSRHESRDKVGQVNGARERYGGRFFQSRSTRLYDFVSAIFSVSEYSSAILPTAFPPHRNLLYSLQHAQQGYPNC